MGASNILGAIIVVVGGYLLYKEFKQGNLSKLQTGIQNELLTPTQGLLKSSGIDYNKGIASVVSSAAGSASVSSSTLAEFAQTHDYGVFTRAALNG